MSDPRPKELIHAEELLYDGNVEESLEIVTNFEKKSSLSPKEKLFSMILRGKIYTRMHEFKKAIKVGEIAYPLSQDLGMVPESIEALTLQAQKAFLWNSILDEVLGIISKAEKLLGSLPERTTSTFLKLKYGILFSKSLINWNMGDYDMAIKLGLKSLNFVEKTDNKVDIGVILQSLGLFSAFVDLESALEYAMRSLTHFEKISYQLGTTMSLSLIGGAYYLKGDFERALEYSLRSLSANKVSDYTKSMSYLVLGHIYLEKGDLNKALEYYNQGAELSGKIEVGSFPNFILRIGITYRMMGNRKLAIKYLKRGGSLPGAQLYKILSLFSLFHIYIETDTIDQARKYLASLREIADQLTQNKIVTQLHLLAKALMFKRRGLSRNRAEAERLLKEIINGEIFHVQYYILSLVSLCDFLLEELQEYNDPELLDELNPLISRLLKIAENTNSHLYFSEAKLLQAKLALIQMNIEEAKYLLTEAQNSAESHGLILLAQKISSEHDNLLERNDEWDELKKKNSSMADRIELASFDGVLNRLQGKQAVDPPELVEEEPILLLIMDNSGVTYFNHPFLDNWDHSDLFGSFMSAFNTFSSEIFSKSIDRIRIGENTILINPVEEFLACYVIKGQSYPALQKLTRFTEAIRENSDIWQALNKSVKTSEILEIDNPPELKKVINEIFT